MDKQENESVWQTVKKRHVSFAVWTTLKIPTWNIGSTFVKIQTASHTYFMWTLHK